MNRLLIVSVVAATIKGQTLMLSPNPVEIGSSFTVNCLDSIDSGIEFFLNSVSKGTCPIPFGPPGICSPPEIGQDQQSGNTSWTVSAASLADQGVWNCTGISGSSNQLELKMFKCPATAVGTGISANLILNETTKIDIAVDLDCSYSPNSQKINLHFQPTSGAEYSVDLNCTMASSTCSVGLFAYQCTHEIAYSHELKTGTDYSLAIEFEPTIGTCNRIDLFSSHKIKFIIEGESGTDGKSCDEPLIFVLFFILTLVCVATIFCLVIWFNLRFPNIGKRVLIISGVVVDLLFEILLLWGIEYGSDFMLFNSDINCRVVIIGIVCHVVAVVVEIVKVVVQYLYIEELGDRIFVCCRPDGEIKKVRKGAVEEHPSRDGRKGPSADNQSKMVAKPEDIMLFMHFTVPLGYRVNKWVTEENTSIENNPKYVSNDRGTLLIKSATEKDNGIYQGILTSDGNEQRVNAVLHVTGQKSANLIINPLIWRQVKTKKLKKIADLKEIRKKVSINDIESIPMKNELESNVRIMSIRWEHNGKITQNLSKFKVGDDSVPPLTVTKHQPIDEYHCIVDFTNKKSHVYIFIVKFTGVRFGNTDDVVGVPTVLSAKREETTSSLPPLRHTATTAQDRQTSDNLLVDENNLQPVTARSSQSTGAEDNL